MKQVFATFHIRRLWTVICMILLLTSAGHFYSIDEERMFISTIQIWDVIRSFSDPTVVLPDRIFTKYGPVPSVLALPLYGIGSFVASIAPVGLESFLVRMFATWVNVFTTASAAVLLGWLTIQRRHSVALAYLMACTYAFGTMAWTYTGSFFSEPTAAFFLLAASIPIFTQPTDTTRLRWLILASGFATFGAIQTKAGIAFALPVIGITVAYVAYRDKDWHKLILWGSAAILSAIFFLIYNYYVYGGVLSTGYAAGGPTLYIPYIINGLYGQFLSSGKSVFLYNPVVFLWPLGLYLQIRHRDWVVASLTSAVIAGVVIVHANVTYWHGDGAWGPRYLLMIIPFMLLAVSDAFAWIHAQARYWRWLAVTFFVATTLFVQLAGKLVSINPYLINSGDLDRYYSPIDSPILGHWRIIIAQLREDIDQHLGTRVNLAGWAYSEGDRSRGEQFPRISSNRATISIVPNANQHPILKARYHNCFPDTALPKVTVQLEEYTIFEDIACPPRTMRILLPDKPSTVSITSPGVKLNGYIEQHKWYEYLGSVVQMLEVYDATQVYPIKAPLIPAAQMPTGPVALRIWLSDIRIGFYDFWWYYLSIVPVPTTRIRMFLLIYAIIALIGALSWRWQPYQPEGAEQQDDGSHPRLPEQALTEKEDGQDDRG
jgi:hypothetical protein